MADLERRAALRVIGGGSVGLASALGNVASALGLPAAPVVSDFGALRADVEVGGLAPQMVTELENVLPGMAMRLLRRQNKYRAALGDGMWKLDADLATLKSVSMPIKLLIQRHRQAQREAWYDLVTGSDPNRSYDHFD